jgi:Immunoglobulin I-set domain.
MKIVILSIATILYLFLLSLASVKPENYEVFTENEQAVVPCAKMATVKGDSILWKKNGYNILEKEETRAKITSNGSLVINPVNRDDFGIYQCTITTKRYDDEEVNIQRTMFLNVKCKLKSLLPGSRRRSRVLCLFFSNFFLLK